METEFDIGRKKLRELAETYAKFFGHCQGILDNYSDNKIDAFGVAMHLREVVATYEEVIKQLK